MAIRDRLRQRAHTAVDAFYGNLGGSPEDADWRRERFYYASGDLARAVQIAVDAFYGYLGGSPKLKRWRLERFYAAAGDLVTAVQISDRAGRPYLISSRDLRIGGELLVKGGFDVGRIDVAESLLRERGIKVDYLLDIGANIGTTTIEWLGRMPTATAHAFEPAPENAKLLRYNIVANGLADRVSVNEVALSDQDGYATLELSADNPGDHRVRVGDALDREAVQIQTARLDTMVAAGAVPASATTLVCMDVQGHEAQVMDGAPRLFAERPPLMLEFWPRGLRLAGGFDRLLEHLATYPVLFEVSRWSRMITVEELLEVDESLSDVGALELLALPH